MSKRDYNDERYTKWRKMVRRRDGHVCQFPGCKSRKRLQVHHIVKWASSPGLRFNVDNGVTLCKVHHDFIKGSEERWGTYFHRIVRQNAGKD